jgi:hypothetical protein
MPGYVCAPRHGNGRQLIQNTRRLKGDSYSQSEMSSCLLRIEVRGDIDFRSSDNTVIFIHGTGLPYRHRLLLFKIMQSNSYRYSENILLIFEYRPLTSATNSKRGVAEIHHMRTYLG